MNNFMGFDDIFDVDDILDDAKETEGSVSDEEKNSGLWDSGTKENIWRGADDVDSNAVWDSGGCPSCPDECEECDPAEDEELPEVLDDPNPEPEDEVAEDSSGGMFDDIF